MIDKNKIELKTASLLSRSKQFKSKEETGNEIMKFTDEIVEFAEKEIGWISLKEKHPEENQTVWACNINTGYVALCCLVYEDGWLWAKSNGLIYSENGKIVSECETDDDYDFTHWIPLPELPIIKEKDNEKK